MNIIEVKERNTSLIEELLIIWFSSVKNTHLFLSSNEITKIKEYVPQSLLEIEHLIIIKNDDKDILGFMGIADHKLEMIFISNKERNKGLGKELLLYGMDKYLINELCVNEQNPLAIGFYKYMGFETYKRTEHDEQGNPYPILYMKLHK